LLSPYDILVVKSELNEFTEAGSTNASRF